MRGKNTCKILKEIRRQIAEQNDIELVVSECTYQGDCLGTCPKCEAEVRYLERELAKRQALGKAAVISGMAMTTFLGMSSCDNILPRPLGGDVPAPDIDTVELLEGDVPYENTLTDSIENVQNSADSIADKACTTKPMKEVNEITAICGDVIEVPSDSIAMDSSVAKIDMQEEDVLLGVIEETPEFPGGIVKLAEFIYNNIKYPQEAIDAGIEGRVFLSFMVEEDGSITEVKVMKGLGYGCDEEAVRVVSNMPKWKPGKNWRDGKPTRFAYTLPVKFMLDENENE